MSGDDYLGKRTVTLAILVLLCIVVGGYGYLTTEQTGDSGRFYWANTGGAVLFEHRVHSEMTGNCAACHHEKLTASLENQCSDCHDDELLADDFTHADLNDIHEHECTRCHGLDESHNNKSCRDCHPPTQEKEIGTVACVECHDESYSADLIGHDDMVAIEGHSCESCHVPRSISIVYHEQCNRCHERQDRARFVGNDGNARCNTCHLR